MFAVGIAVVVDVVVAVCGMTAAAVDGCAANEPAFGGGSRRPDGCAVESLVDRHRTVAHSSGYDRIGWPSY